MEVAGPLGTPLGLAQRPSKRFGRQPWALSLPDKELCLRDTCKIAWVGIGPLVYTCVVTASPLFGKNNSNTLSRFGICDPTLSGVFLWFLSGLGGCSKPLRGLPLAFISVCMFYWVNDCNAHTPRARGGKVGLFPLNVSKFAKRVNKGIVGFCRISRQNRL